MATITRFEEMAIWQEARILSLKIFQLTNQELFSKEFRFRDQIKAAAGSVMDNIAEGFERSSRLEFINFLSYAKGSCGEVKSQLLKNYDSLASSISGFIIYLNKSDHKGQKFKDRV